jgi:hypothetical protein
MARWGNVPYSIEIESTPTEWLFVHSVHSVKEGHSASDVLGLDDCLAAGQISHITST